MVITAVFNTIALAADAAVLHQLRRRREPRPHALALGVAGIAVLLAARILGEDGFGVLRLYCWALFVHGPVLLLGTAVLLWKHRRGLALVCGAGAAVILAIAADAFVVEPGALETVRYRIGSPKLHRAIRIVVLADIQTDGVGEREREAFRRAMAERPDVILLAGDYVQTERRREVGSELAAAMREAKLEAPLGIYAVGGNTDADGWTAIFEGLPVRAEAATSVVELDDVLITALAWEDSLIPTLKIPETKKFHVVLGHAPDFALGDVRAEMLVAGHTHGGQVQLPFIGPVLTLSRVPRRWAAGGATDLGGGRTLVVSRGVGMERGHAPRLRFLCRPQVVVIDCVPTGK